MTCPPIDDLLDGRAADHAGGCDDCRAVLDLVAARTPADCGRAEALMAARAAGNLSPDSRRLLALHLARCASCAIVADSLDAPEIADALAGAAELDRNLDTRAGVAALAGAAELDRPLGRMAGAAELDRNLDRMAGAAHVPARDSARGGDPAPRAGNPHGESVRGGSVRVESMRGESMRGEPVRGEPVRGVEHTLAAGDRHPRGNAVHSARAALGTRDGRPLRIALAGLALLAIAAVAALVTRALG